MNVGDTMDTNERTPITAPSTALTRRRFLRAAAVAGGGAVAATVAACTPAGAPAWTFGPSLPDASKAPAPAPAGTPVAPSGQTPAPAATPVPSASPTTDLAAMNEEHDRSAEARVKRFLGGEWETAGPYGNQPLEPRIEGDWKVFELECSAFEWRIDAELPPVNALGYNGMWPGPILRVTEGDKVRAIVKNSMAESTTVHFHGQSLLNKMDGVPFITQPPIKPGETFVYEFLAAPYGSHMYHSHHNAADQVGRGLLGAFLVDPKDAKLRHDRRYGITQDIVWVSNDTLGGFTINGRGFPATRPLIAKKGERILVRFMNEGQMMHPWHLHGMPMRVVARDGYYLGSAEFTCDTLGVNPGERYDVIIDCDNPGAWAFHCHILSHAEGSKGMFGMVTALIVE